MLYKITICICHGLFSQNLIQSIYYTHDSYTRRYLQFFLYLRSVSLHIADIIKTSVPTVHTHERTSSCEFPQLLFCSGQRDILFLPFFNNYFWLRGVRAWGSAAPNVVSQKWTTYLVTLSLDAVSSDNVTLLYNFYTFSSRAGS